MSKGLSKKRVFSLSDFKKASRIEKFYIYMMQPDSFTLNDTDFKYFDALQQAFALTCDQISMASAISLIQMSIPEFESWNKANRLYADVQNLYGQIIERNKEFQRILVVEKLRQLAEKAEEQDNITEARRCLVAAGKFEHFDKPDEDGFDPKDFELPQPIFTSDPDALEAEDIDFEELGDKDG